MPPGVRAITGALHDLDALRNAAKDTDTVFHCAAKVHDSTSPDAAFFHVNREGTQNLLNACSSQNAIPPRFVFFSTVAVYGDDTPKRGLPEYPQPCPQTPYAASKVEAEARVAKWARRNHSRAPYTILRVATVYGPRDRGNLARMMKAIAQNRFLMVGNGRNLKTCANVENVVAAAIAVSKLERPTSIVVADPAPVTLRELHDAMHTALVEAGWKFPPRRLPALSLPVPVALALSAGVTGAARLAGRKSPLTPSQVKRLASDNVYQTERLSTITGYFPQATLSQGMLDAAKWLISEGQLR